MDGLITIKNKLTEIANKLNIESAEVTTIIDLLANAIYLDELNCTNVVLEGNCTTATKMNSVIIHALDRMYHVGRGSNRSFKMKVKPLITYSVKKFDVCFEYDGFKWVFAEDYNFNNGVEIIIKLILATDILRISSTTSSGDYCVRFVNANDVSEDVILIRNQDDKILTWTDNINYYNANSNNDADYLLLTDVDYSVIVYSDEAVFSSIGDYSVKYLKYIDEDSDVTTNSKATEYITEMLEEVTINNLAHKIGDGESVKDLKVYDKIYRDSDPSKLVSRLQVYYDSNFTIRSTADIQNVVAAAMPDRVVSTNSVIGDDKILHVYYLCEEFGDELSNAEIAEVKSKVKFAYNVGLDDLDLERATQKISTSRQINFIIKVTNESVKLAIDEVANEYSHRIGYQVNCAELAVSVARIDGVISLQWGARIIPNIGDNEYFDYRIDKRNIDWNITYQE